MRDQLLLQKLVKKKLVFAPVIETTLSNGTHYAVKLGNIKIYNFDFNLSC